MKQKNNWRVILILAVLVLALLVVFPIHKGVLGKKDVVLGLDLQGGLYLVYEADLSEIDSDSVEDVMKGITSVLENRVNPYGITEAVIEQQGDHVTVKVGSVPHPMLDVHWIEWIVLETATGYQKKDLKPGEAPEAEFAVTEPVLAAYEYCNLHGLWKAEA